MSKEAPAFVFPGQGSQEVGMAEQIYRDCGNVQELFRQADEVLETHGWNRALREFCLDGPQNLTELCFQGPKEVLALTQFTQPALYIANHAYSEFLKEDKGIFPTAVAGHSLGEYSALTVAGFLGFEDGVRLVAERGRLMTQAGEDNPGKMVAVLGLETAVVEESITSLGEVYIANINCPGQIILSGEKEAVDLAIKAARAAGARLVKELDVSIASHCSLMQSVAESLREVIETVNFTQPDLETKPPVAFYSSTTAMRIDSHTQIKELLVLQLTSRVLWAKTVQQMINDGYTHFIEVGPGNVLSKLIRRIDKNVRVQSVNDYII